MIEKFLIDYNDQKVQAVRSAVGKYYVMLPEMIDFQGKKVDGIVARVNGAWSIIIGDRKSPDSLTVFLKDDKSVEFQKGNDSTKRLAGGVFNPHAKSETMLWDYCKTIYDVAEGIYAHEKLNIPTDKLNDIRELYLRAFIKLLGYGSVDKVKFGTSTCSPEYLLREIGEKLETYKSLTSFIHREMTDKGDIINVCEVTTDSDKASLVFAVNGIQQDGDELIKALDFRIEELNARRKVNDSYCAKRVRPVNKDDYSEEDRRVMGELRKFALNTYGVQYKDLTEAQKRTVNKKINETTELEEIWGKGIIVAAEVNWNTCAYVARYVTKKVGLPTEKEHYKALGIEPEFFRMSRRPGIGREYYEQHKDEIYKKDKIIIQKYGGGLMKIKPPKYYDKLYDIENHEKMEEIKKKRKKDSERLNIIKYNQTTLYKKDQLKNEEQTKELQNKVLIRTKV